MKTTYECKGGEGCKKPGCVLTANGSPESKKEIYALWLKLCPFNNWRSAQWVKVKNHKPNTGK